MVRFFILFLVVVNFGFLASAKIPTSIEGLSIVECEKNAKILSDSEKNFSTAVMNEISNLENKCVRRLMNKNLDARLLLLKRDDSLQFKKEMNLQAEFNSAVKNFEDHYRSNCSGSSCGGCRPSLELYKYRYNQTELILKKSLEISGASKTIKNADKDADKFFSGFAKLLCDLPKGLWKKEIASDKCIKLAKEEIAQNLKFFYAVPENEGDVCAQL